MLHYSCAFATLVNSLFIKLFSSDLFFFHTSSASYVVLALEPSKESERKEGGREGKKTEGKELGCVWEVAKAG